MLVDKLVIGLLANGHLLLEGAPGLAKTRAMKTLASLIDASFARIQFTPDLLPSDITGTDIFRPDISRFEFQHGPIFHQIILADEINRAPAKVQSALLEAMAESQVSVGNNTFALPEFFMVVATQNTIEQEGTYRLPEAQLDRFLIQITVDYPGIDAENEILELARRELYPSTGNDTAAPVQPDDLSAGRREIMTLHMSATVQRYLLQLVAATRQPGAYGSDLGEEIEKDLSFGASPRASIALDRVARARAWLDGRDYVTPDDVQAMAHDCLRHRLVLSLAAQSAGRSNDDVIDDLLSLVPTA